MYKKYSSVKEFVCDLIDNEGVIFRDNYCRRWAYRDYEFIYADIDSQFQHGLDYLHLYGTGITKEQTK